MRTYRERLGIFDYLYCVTCTVKMEKLLKEEVTDLKEKVKVTEKKKLADGVKNRKYCLKHFIL